MQSLEKKFESHCATLFGCWLLQRSPPEKLFTDCFKAVLVLLSDTQQSVTGREKMGKTVGGINKRYKLDVNQKHHVDDM